jgi:cytochrome c5
LIAIIYPLTNKSFNSAADAGASAGADEAELRIQPVAGFALAKADAAAASSAPKDGPTVYNTVCGACHNTGAAGAPKIDDKAAWAPRVATGNDALYNSALNGKNAMPARGGVATLSDDEVKATVDYILTKVK